MIDDQEMDRLRGLGETFLEHHGVKGMRWGVRQESSAFRKSFSPEEKYVALILARSGAAVITTLLAGPVAGMTVSGLSQIATMPLQKRLMPTPVLSTKVSAIR